MDENLEITFKEAVVPAAVIAVGTIAAFLAVELLRDKLKARRLRKNSETFAYTSTVPKS